MNDKIVFKEVEKKEQEKEIFDKTLEVVKPIRMALWKYLILSFLAAGFLYTLLCILSGGSNWTNWIVIVLSIIFGLVYTYILTRPFGKHNPELLNNFYAFVKNKYKDIEYAVPIYTRDKKNRLILNRALLLIMNNNMYFEAFKTNRGVKVLDSIRLKITKTQDKTAILIDNEKDEEHNEYVLSFKLSEQTQSFRIVYNEEIVNKLEEIIKLM